MRDRKSAWTTHDELQFILRLQRTKNVNRRHALLAGYRDGLYQRMTWGPIDRETVLEGLNAALGES